MKTKRKKKEQQTGEAKHFEDGEAGKIAVWGLPKGSG